MKRWTIAIVLGSLLGACATTPVVYHYGYYDGGYYRERYPYYDRYYDDRYYGRYDDRYGYYDRYSFYNDHGK